MAKIRCRRQIRLGRRTCWYTALDHVHEHPSQQFTESTYSLASRKAAGIVRHPCPLFAPNGGFFRYEERSRCLSCVHQGSLVNYPEIGYRERLLLLPGSALGWDHSVSQNFSKCLSLV